MKLKPKVKNCWLLLVQTPVEVEAEGEELLVAAAQDPVEVDAEGEELLVAAQALVEVEAEGEELLAAATPRSG